MLLNKRYLLLFYCMSYYRHLHKQTSYRIRFKSFHFSLQGNKAPQNEFCREDNDKCLRQIYPSSKTDKTDSWVSDDLLHSPLKSPTRNMESFKQKPTMFTKTKSKNHNSKRKLKGSKRQRKRKKKKKAKKKKKS